MPLPENLASLVAKMADDFQPDFMRAEYLQKRETWEIYLDLFELDRAKLMTMVERHGDLLTQPDTAETDESYARRQKLAAVFNYVPTVVRMMVNYIFSERPEIDADNPELKKFLQNCDGRGMPLEAFIRKSALPLSLVFGFLDVFVQNPATAPGETPASLADVQSSGVSLSPRVLCITPLQRINWSVRPDHSYNWISFTDKSNEETNPFVNDPEAGDSYFRISSKYVVPEANPWKLEPGPVLDQAGNHNGFFIKSWKDDDNKWVFDGDFMPSGELPVSSLYYIQSIDHRKRHFGISKIAMIAICTFKIIQLLSWTDEDVLANIGMFVFPGDPPKDPNDATKNKRIALNPMGILWMGNDAKFPAQRLVGDTGNISIKMELIDKYIEEILRLAFIIGASAQAEVVTSGVQGVVSRNELFMELADLAGSLDRFTMELMGHALTWINGTESEEGLMASVKAAGGRASFHKGPYAIDPLATIIANTKELETIFADLSPTLLENVYRQCAASAMYNDDAQRAIVFQEIADGFQQRVAENATRREALNMQLEDTGDGTTTNENTGDPIPTPDA